VPKLTLARLTDPIPGAVYPDPAVEGLRYQARARGRVTAQLRFKAPGKGWQSHGLGYVDVHDRIADLIEETTEWDEHGNPFLPHHPTLDEVLEPIRARARELRRRLRTGEAPQGGGLTLGPAVARYLSDIKPARRPRTFKEIERHLTRDWKPLHHRPITQLSRAEIADRLDKLKQESGPVARNRARADLHALFEWSVERDLAPVNPVAGTRKVPEASRKRVLEDWEVREVWAATSGMSDYDRIVRLCLITGQRDGRVGGMRWSEIDLDAARWSLPSTQTKNKEPVSVPLSGLAVNILREVLAERRRAIEDARQRGETVKERSYVFGKGAGPYSGWSRSKARLDDRIARARAERRLGRTLEKGEEPAGGDRLAHWVLHDARRTMRTNLGRLRVPRDIRELAIGHTVQGIEAVYDLWTYETEKRDALERWARLLAEIVGEPAPEPAAAGNVIAMPAARGAA
jgi:integrase